MIDHADIQLPSCLADHAFMNFEAHDSVTGGPTLRINRIPQSLRNEQYNQFPEGCRVWRELLTVMDRNQTDRVIIKPVDQPGKARLEVDFFDPKEYWPARMIIDLGFPPNHAPWLEHLLADCFSRYEPMAFRSALQPEYIERITQGLDCYNTLGEGRASRHLFHRFSPSGPDYKPDDRDIPGSKQGHELGTRRHPNTITRVHNKPDATLFYFNMPERNAPYLSWRDAWDGPRLELLDGSSSPIVLMTQYRFSGRVSYALSGELDYLARLTPHWLLGNAAIPGLKTLFGQPAPLDDSGTQAPGLEDIEKFSQHYAPGWLSNLRSASEPLGRLFGQPATVPGPACNTPVPP